MGNLFTEEVGKVLTEALGKLFTEEVGKVLTEALGKLLDIYISKYRLFKIGRGSLSINL